MPFVISAYLETQKILNPAGLAASALEQYGRRASDQDEETMAMLSKIKNLKATFEDGKLTVHLDKKTMLELVEAQLKRIFAKEEAGMTATFRYDLVSAKDLDGELRLPSRSIYVKFVPQGTSAVEYANSYVERARRMNPSELWLLTLTQERVDVTFDPVFRENGVTRGGLRTLALTSVFRELVGKDYDISATEEDGGYKFLVSKKEEAVPNVR